MKRHRCGTLLAELAAGLVGLGLFATLVAGAYGGVRQRQRIEQASARLEEAQDLLARWRAGAVLREPGWTVEERRVGAALVLTLRGHGLALSTLRPAEAR